jgi:hypothetical protein
MTVFVAIIIAELIPLDHPALPYARLLAVPHP